MASGSVPSQSRDLQQAQLLNEAILEVQTDLARAGKGELDTTKAYAESILSGEPWRFSPKGNRVYAYVRGFLPDFRIRGFFDYKDGIERVRLRIRSHRIRLLCEGAR